MERAQALIGLSERLLAAALEAQEHLDRRALLAPERLEQLTQLANAYRAEMARVKADPSLLKGAPRPVLDALFAVSAKLRGAIDQHRRELAVFKNISEGLAEAMAQEAARLAQPTLAYGARGMLASASGPAPAVAVNQSA
jgi:hypothetical protein